MDPGSQTRDLCGTRGKKGPRNITSRPQAPTALDIVVVPGARVGERPSPQTPTGRGPLPQKGCLGLSKEDFEKVICGT